MLVSVYDICCIVEREDKQVIRLTKESGRKCFTGTAAEVKKSKYSDYRVSKIRALSDTICLKIYKL